MEHSVIGIHEIEQLTQVIESAGCTSLVRLSSNDPILTKRVMDAGACGVIVPMINTREEAEKAVSAVKYPPQGNRGVGLYRAQGYGPDFEDYVRTANERSVVILQVEHVEGIQNIEAILDVAGIDGVIIGPYDLSCSLGLPGQLNDPKVAAARESVLETAKAKGIAAGIHVVHPSIDEYKKRVEEGYRLIAFGVDFLFLGESCRESARVIKQING